MTIAPTKHPAKTIAVPSGLTLGRPNEATKTKILSAAQPIVRDHRRPDAHSSPVSDHLLLLIRHLGRTLDDLEGMRIRHQNRRSAAERELGYPLPPDPVLLQLKEVEHEAELELRRLWRKHPLAPWAKPIKGAGEKLMGRLIAEIGDPASRENVAQLWSYCGLNPERRRRKGMSQDEALACGNPNARKTLWKIASSLLKQGNREVYDMRRAHTAETHPDWTPGHSHEDALRIVAKVFVRELWIAARREDPANHQKSASGKDGRSRPLSMRIPADDPSAPSDPISTIRRVTRPPHAFKRLQPDHNHH